MTDNRIKQLFRAEGQSAWQDDISRDMLNEGAFGPRSRRRHPRAHLESDHLREGHRRRIGLRRGDRWTARARPRCSRDLRDGSGPRYPGRRRSLPPDLRVIRGR